MIRFYKALASLLLLSSLTPPGPVNARENVLSQGGNGKAVATARLWGKNKKPSLTYHEFHIRVQNLVNTFTMKEEDAATVKKSVKSIALYRYIDAGRYLLRPKLYNVVEDTLTGKIIAANNFTLKECLECDPKKLVVREGWLSSLSGTDLSQNLAKTAGRVGVDGFLLWNVYSAEDQLFLSVAIIHARSGRIVWSGRFNEEMIPVKIILKPKSRYEKIITFGAWGHKVSRTYKTTELKVSEDIIGAVSFRIRRDAKDNRNFAFGVGGDYFKNVVTKDDTDLSGFTFYGHLNYKLDGLISGETPDTVPVEPAPSLETSDAPESATETGAPVEENPVLPKPAPIYVSTYNLYLDLGQAFFMDDQTEFVKTGFEFRSKGGFVIGIGAVFLPVTESVMTVPSGYNPTVSFGGTSYELSFGYLF